MSTRPPQFGPKSRCFESTFESFLLFKGWAHHRLALDFRHPAWLSSWRGDDVAEQNPEVVISSLNYEELVSARLLRLCFLFLFLFLLFRRFNHRRDSVVSCRASANFSRPNRESRIVGENPKTRGGFLINLGETSVQVGLFTSRNIPWLASFSERKLIVTRSSLERLFYVLKFWWESE